MNLDKLVKRFKSGDEKAFDALYDATKTPVYYTILRITKDQSLSEDIMQETYMQMIQKIDQYEAKGQFLAWIKTIAKNKALNKIKARSKETPADTSAPEWRISAKTSKSDAQYRLEKMLKILDEEAQFIVVRHVLLNETFKSIAEYLDKPLGTVLWKYRESLKKMKREDGGDEKTD